MSGKVSHFIKRVKDGAIKEKFGDLLFIWPYTKHNIIFVILYTLLGLSGTATGIISGLVSKDLVDIITNHRTGELIKAFVMLISTALLSTIISQVSIIITTKITLKIKNEIQGDVFDKIITTEWEDLSKYHSSDLIYRWNGDSSQLSTGVLTYIPNIIINITRLISALAVVISYDASFAVIAICCMPISLIASRTTMKRMKDSNMSTITASTKLSSFSLDIFSNSQTIKAFDMIGYCSKRLRELQKDHADAQMKYQRNMAINSLIFSIVSLFTTYVAYGWGVYRVWSGVITYGTMTMFLTLTSTLSGSINSFIGLVPSTISLCNASKRVREIQELPKEDYSQRTEVKAFFDEHRTEGVGLCVRDLAYTYATGTEVFTKASLDAHPHEVVSFVGPSGEGKTTMLRFLLSIIRAKAGNGYLCAGNSTPESGGPCMDLTASVRQLIAYVPQGNTMLSGTLAENMRNVRQDATDEEIIEALKMACAWSFIEKLPEGINSPIQERGGGFSEGQAQRLSIARALLKKAPILLLDEATSALDIDTEKEVLKNIMADDYPRTTIITTHRPSVLRMCKRVYSIRNLECVTLSESEINDLLSSY